jgi:hypothetical protein
MELEDLKNVWEQYDKKLVGNLKLNEELLKKMNLDKSKHEISGRLKYEVFSLIGNVLFSLYLAVSTFKYSSDIMLLIPGIISFGLLVLVLIFCATRIKSLLEIDFYNSTVVTLQKALNSFQLRYFKINKYELYLFPVFLITIIPIMAKALINLDVYSHLNKFILYVVIGFVFYYSAAIWIYKDWYEKKMKYTSKFLNELNKFENEE